MATFGRGLPRLFQESAWHISRLASQFDWPYDCCLCREPDTDDGICSACSALIASNPLACQFCASPGAVQQPDTTSIIFPRLPANDSSHFNQPLPDNRVCTACTIERPHYHAAVVPYLYRFPANQLVIQLKFHDSPGVARAMAQLMAGSLRAEIERAGKRPDFLVPVPLQPARFRLRGFNQSMQLCRRLSVHLKIPVHATALTRLATVDNDHSQTGLDREARLAAGNMAFSASDVEGLDLLLIDDVMTTGATFTAATESLLAAGAARVTVSAFARTPR